ncbi:transcriptional regulator [Tepiditoga spiralis]|uniref:Transcriptional regulator n=1 Tax=Tepiditoga spiralis TaxID=2108365 RepID=A0A7G1G1F9_9BACT|nr:response regulator transcription factor [Tepiditoga spiralis]BBE30111.1 transcriptional regulator [Tepiditoga spiralis]
MKKLYLIEDDKKLATHLSVYLRKNRYEVYTVFDFRKIEEEFKKINPDLVIMDVNLPYNDGFYLCRNIRKVSKVPIIFLTARIDPKEQVLGMELGGDDYIIKPFNYQVLIAKINAIFRRYSSFDEVTLKYKKFKLSADKMLLYFEDKKINLSKTEFQILWKLFEKQEETVNRDEILESIWKNGDFVDENTLNVNLTRLRNKLKTFGIKNFIKTIRKKGYTLNSNYEEEEK